MPGSSAHVAVFPGLERLARIGLPWSMGHHTDNEDLPQDEHLREDINLPAPDRDNEDEHLAQDINLPREEAVGPEFDDRHYTAGQLNAGQQVAGLSPNGEYGKMRGEELGN